MEQAVRFLVAKAGGSSLRLFALLAAMLLVSVTSVFAAGQANVYIGATSGAPGGTASVDVLLSMSGGAQVSGLQFDVGFDYTRVSVTGARDGAVVTSAGKSITWREISSGVSRVIVPPSFGGGPGTLSSGTLGYLDFSIHSSASAGPMVLDGDNASATDPSANAVLMGVYDGALTVTGGLLKGCCPWILPASASASGAGGSLWKTRLALENSGATPVALSLYFLESGKDNSNAPAASVSVAAGELVVIDDVVKSSFGLTGKAGAVAIDSSSNQIRVTSRTYNVGGSCGTFGQGISALRLGEMFAAGQTADLVPVFGDAVSFRTNLGIVNASALSATFDVRVIDSKGIEKTARPILLAPWSHTQINDLLAAWAISLGGADGRILVTTSTSGVRFGAYLSVVDNGSGDPAYFPAAD